MNYFHLGKKILFSSSYILVSCEWQWVNRDQRLYFNSLEEYQHMSVFTIFIIVNKTKKWGKKINHCFDLKYQGRCGFLCHLGLENCQFSDTDKETVLNLKLKTSLYLGREQECKTKDIKKNLNWKILEMSMRSDYGKMTMNKILCRCMKKLWNTWIR